MGLDVSLYNVWFNTEAGVTIVKQAFLPDGDLTPPDLGPLPQDQQPLRRLSDYLFVVYKSLCTTDAEVDMECLQGLKWVFHKEITNEVSIAVAKQACGFRPDATPR